MKQLTTLLSAILLLAALPSEAWAQGRSIPKGSEAKAQEDATKVVSDVLPEGQKYRYPFFNGLSLSVDLFDPLLSLFTLEHCTVEAQAMADLHHRFFPMVSVGMGWADERSNNGMDYVLQPSMDETTPPVVIEKQELRFKSSPAPFGKIGLAYNLKYNDLRPQDYYMVLMRYGIAWNQADISNLYYPDDIWGALGPLEINDQSYTTQWVELGGMLRVQIWQRFSLGWDVYWKIKLAQSGTSLGEPYYVPGFGTTQSSVGFSFRLFYDLF